MGALIPFRRADVPYKGASYEEAYGRLWLTFTQPADDELAPVLETLRSRSRALCRNDVAGGIIENVVTNVIGPGLQLDVVLDPVLLGVSPEEADKWGRDVERRFRLWANSQDPDIKNRTDFNAIQRLAFRSQLMDGDAIALLTNIERNNSISSLRINTIDAARVSGAEKNTGIETDTNGMPIKFNVLLPKEGYRKIDVYHPIGLRNIVHSYVEVRPGQSRGYPFLASIIARLRKLEKYSDAELGAAVITAFMALAFTKQESKNGKTPASFAEFADGDKTTATETKKHDVILQEGTQVDLEAGEDIKVIKSDRPNTNYQPFTTAIWNEIAMALNIPYEVLIKQFGRSYSASRGAIHEAFKYFLTLRSSFAAEFVQPVYERWLYEEVAEGRIKAPGYLDNPYMRRLWSAARWIGPPKGMLDENKEASAAKTRIEAGISTRKKEIANIDGGNIEDVHNQLKRERKMQAELEATTKDTEDAEDEPLTYS